MMIQQQRSYRRLPPYARRRQNQTTSSGNIFASGADYGPESSSRMITQ
jgi:hypothetical protein